jgi:hypothetical protein
MIVVCTTLALCLTSQMSNLGAHLGEHFASRDPHHLDRWRVALIAGLAQKRCAAIARSTGQRCRGTPLRFSTKCRCHCLGSERIAVDAKRLSWLERQLPRTGNAKVRANVEARIARIERRRLRWAWRTDPTVEGATILLSPRDLERVWEWLRRVARVDDLDALTARCRDRLLWAGALCIARRTTQETALQSVRTALKDEARWLITTGGSLRSST